MPRSIKKKTVKGYIKGIYIPHLAYWVKVMDIHKAEGDIENYISSRGRAPAACAHRVCNSSAEIYLTFPLKVNYYSTIGHEVVHILQYIAEARDMQFRDEEEHFAYLFQFIFNEIIGMHYSLPKNVTKVKK